MPSFESTLNRCSCGHLDMEHRLMLRDDFVPVGHGSCSVCGEEKCKAFTDPNNDTKIAEAAIKEKQQKHDMIVNKAQMMFVQRMVDDPEFYANIRRVVVVNRVNVLNISMKSLQESEDFPAIIETCSQLIDDIREFDRLAEDGFGASVKRWWSLATLFTTLHLARFRQWSAAKSAASQEAV